jgi:hypothetical protein
MDGVEVGGDVLQAVPSGDLPQGVLAAAEQDRLGPEHGAVAEVESALVAQGEDRPDEVLAVAHAPGHAVHGDTHRPACHVSPLRGRRAPCTVAAPVMQQALSAGEASLWPGSAQHRVRFELFEGANNRGPRP